MKLHPKKRMCLAFSTNSSPTPINYAPPSSLSKNEVQDMIGQAMDSFTECQRLENEQFQRSMQESINTQFTNLGAILLQNLPQAQMSLLVFATSQPPIHPQPPQVLYNHLPPSSVIYCISYTTISQSSKDKILIQEAIQEFQG